METGRPPQGATPEALGELYTRGFHTYLRVAEAIVGDADAAYEVVQDTFARALRSRSRFRGTGSLEGWLWRILVNTARSSRRGTASAAVPHGDAGDRAATFDGGPPAHDIRTAVAELPERQRLVLFLRHYADLDYRGIGEALGIERGTVGATLSQAHAVLRRVLEEVPR